MGQRIEPLEVDLLPTLQAVPELLRGAEEPAERLVDVPEVAPFLGGKEELLLPLHRVGPLVRHVEGIG
jgi:hypothetical protein